MTEFYEGENPLDNPDDIEWADWSIDSECTLEQFCLECAAIVDPICMTCPECGSWNLIS